MGLLTVLKKMKQKEKEMRILILGLDNAGKTTILKRFNGEEINTISPTLGFNIKTLQHDSYQLNIWDVGGQKSLRSYWRNYFESTDGLVWVVDSADRRRIEDCRNELFSLLKEERLAGATLLVFCNKQDLDGSMSCQEIKDVLKLDEIRSHHWKVLPCSAVTALNLLEGVNWLVQDISLVGRPIQVCTQYFTNVAKSCPSHLLGMSGAQNESTRQRKEACGPTDMLRKLRRRYELETCLYLLEPWEKMVVNCSALIVCGIAFFSLAYLY